MMVVLLTIVQIRECVLKLVESAKIEIPKFPKETWSIEKHYVSKHIENYREIFIFSFECNPALYTDKTKKMMVSCVICSLSKGVEMQKPIMYEPVDRVVEIIDSEEMVNKCIKTFEKILQDIMNYDPID